MKPIEKYFYHKNQKPLSRQRWWWWHWVAVCSPCDWFKILKSPGGHWSRVFPRFPSCSFVSGARFTCWAGCRSARFVSRKSDDSLTRLISGVMADIIFPCGVGLFWSAFPQKSGNKVKWFCLTWVAQKHLTLLDYLSKDEITLKAKGKFMRCSHTDALLWWPLSNCELNLVHCNQQGGLKLV